MGNCGSGNSDPDANKQNKVIDDMLKKDKKEMEREVKMLLLGNCQSPECNTVLM